VSGRSEAGVAAYLALGSNLGDRARSLSTALRRLAGHPDVDLLEVSSVYETDPVGPPPQGAYYNAAAKLRTRLTPLTLLAFFQRIEAESGRVRNGTRNAARTLDLDLLLYGQEQIGEPGLVVPHPRMQERSFVLEPLAELAPRLQHPALGATIAELAAAVRDPAGVRRISVVLEF